MVRVVPVQHADSLRRTARGQSTRPCALPDLLEYHGRVADAPALPLEILTRELELSLSEVERCRMDMEAPYDWAPGGMLYEKLIREGESVKEIYIFY